MDSDLTIRLMEKGDLDTVVDIEEKTFPMPFSRSLFQKFMDHDDFFCWLVLKGEEVVGYLIYSCDVGEVDLLNIAVVEKWRRRGIGSELMNHLYGHVQGLGGKRVYLEVRPSNEAAIKFYERLGFFQIGLRRGYYHDTGEDALVYMRTI